LASTTWFSLHRLKYPQPVKLATLQNQVLQKGEILLVYGVLSGNKKEYRESKTILWIIGKNQFQMLTLNISHVGWATSFG